MILGRKFVTLALGCALLASVGCAKKKPQLPSQAKAPAEPVTEPLPDEISETVPPPPPPAPAPEPKRTETTQVKPPKKRSKRKVVVPNSSIQAATPPTANPPAASASNSNTVAMNRPPANPAGEAPPSAAIAADVTTAQLNHQKQSTVQLLDETEKSISGLKSLSHDEEEMVAQIRSYVNQSRKATSEGDFERAYNLATKAHLLSDALVKK